MLSNPVVSLWRCFQILFMVLLSGSISVLYAATPLNESSPQYYKYVEGKPYFVIDTPGEYYLDVGDTFYTLSHNAIRIRCSNVKLDGRGTTITGDQIPGNFEASTPNVCGVRINGGNEVKNVEIRNLTVKTKYFGIWFEYINGGRTENCTTIENHSGIYLWNAKNLTINNNTASNNLKNGITLDGADGSFLCKNLGNILSNNTADSNGEVGIILHLDCENNTLSDNTIKGNHHGISFSGMEGQTSPRNNTLTGNTVSGNIYGIMLGYNANGNVIKGNTITQSRDWGIYLDSCSNNTLYNNYLKNSLGNVRFDGAAGANQWHIDRTAGENIVGGPYLGGNYWATPEGTGFSQITGDSNGDGFCDSAYAINGQNVDQLPLCGSGTLVTAPTVTTSDISSITCDSASGGGDVIADGGASVTARGICWSLSQNHTINASCSSDGSGTGSFESSMTGLTPGTTYYVRAYATSSAGTGYGEDLSFETKPFEGIIYVSNGDMTCGDHHPCYGTIQSAIDAPYEPDVIKISQGIYTGTFVLDKPSGIILEGGWSDSFTSQTSNSTFIRPPMVESGSVTLRNVIIRAK